MLVSLAQGLLADASEEMIAILATGAGGAVAISAIVASQLRRARESAYNARLKQLMIERGMSADEIERVIRSGPGEPR